VHIGWLGGEITNTYSILAGKLGRVRRWEDKWVTSMGNGWNWSFSSGRLCY